MCEWVGYERRKMKKTKKNIINKIEKLTKYILEHKDSLNEKEIKEHIANETNIIMKLINGNTGAGILDMMSFMFRTYLWFLKQLNEKNPSIVTHWL
jgi:hypothetical protein